MKKPIPFGKYYLLDRISVGGMAEVFKAKAFGVEGFERLIAVKRILPSIAEDEEFITMFIDEAKIAVQLQHANIAQIFDLGKVGDSYFIAMEYVSGKDVRTIFDRMRKNGRPLPIQMACYLGMKICEGLDYAHNRKDAAGRNLNLVHRDVSPQNILISYDGEAKIIDFGIAKAAGKAGKTQAGILKGKFGYMSPEQVRGLPLDRRSDIFAVGICMWEMITGERLFIGESDFSTLEKVRNVDIKPPSSYNSRIPEELEALVLKSLKKEVEDRYQSAMDFHDDLQNWMYTSGNFFARKDLAGFMQEVFRAEIDKEQADLEGSGELVRSTVPPPPKAVKGADGDSVRPGAPPPPPRTDRSTKPPPPIPRGANPGPGSATSPGLSAGRPPGAPPPAGAKRTMQGIPNPSQQTQPRSLAITPDPMPQAQQAHVQAPPPTLDANIGMESWDDDEPATNIYSKQTAAAMAQAAVAAKGAQPDIVLSSTEMALPRSEFGPGSEKRSRPMSMPPSAVAPARGFLSQLKSPVGAVSGIAVLLALAFIYLLFFRGEAKEGGTLHLEVEPQDSLKVIIDGTKDLPGNRSPFKIFQLEPGEHIVTIQRKGYKDRQVTVKVETGQTVARNVTLDKLATGFELETDPPGASVSIDDRPLDDKTPIIVSDLMPGTYIVRITKGEDYAPLSIEVKVEENEIIKLPLKKLDMAEIEVAFKSTPTRAKATLISDNVRKDLGSTPVKAKIDPSKDYEIEFSKDGYDELVKPIEYQPGQSKVSVKATLVKSRVAKPARPDRPSPRVTPRRRPKPKPKPVAIAAGKGMLSVQTRPWSKVYINGKFIKNTPLVKYPLKSGSYRVTLENPTYSIRKNFRVTIQSGKSTTLVKQLM